MEYYQTRFIMVATGNQTEKGKAFEYACAYVLAKEYQKISSVVLVHSPQMETAEDAFNGLAPAEQEKYLKGAYAAIKIINRLEPKLSNPSQPLYISLQTDSSGVAGDVRDVVCAKGNDWGIGLSCKHNHEAVKHSRLSESIDFAAQWFGKSCSLEYFSEIGKVFGPLRKLRDKGKAEGKPILWKNLENKEECCYIPILQAFIKELKRLDTQYPKEIPALLIKYLIGRNDFYKVIMDDSGSFTKIESININGNLNQADGRKKALVNVPVMKLPTKFYEIGFKENSGNTVILVCDQGWNISLRIHNASSAVEPSLKFDVQLIAMPNSILTQIEPWEE